MKYQFVYLNVVTVCLNELDSVCLMAGRAKKTLPGGSLKYQFVYLKIRIFKCSYRIIISIYIYICIYMFLFSGLNFQTRVLKNEGV